MMVMNGESDRFPDFVYRKRPSRAKKPIEHSFQCQPAASFGALGLGRYSRLNPVEESTKIT